ncbi:MAG: hypothetical protein LBE08_04975 [Bifidobacteriaceae bacterium]|jgi:hypothetical protein|nr:hypothetical protein [Bifidobacteriaceae bacterium]
MVDQNGPLPGLAKQILEAAFGAYVGGRLGYANGDTAVRQTGNTRRGQDPRGITRRKRNHRLQGERQQFAGRDSSELVDLGTTVEPRLAG